MPSVCFSVYNKSTTYILFYVTVTTYNKRKMWKKFSCVFRKKNQICCLVENKVIHYLFKFYYNMMQ